MSDGLTILAALAKALRTAAKINASVQTRPAAILWTDPEAQWASVLAPLRREGLTVIQLGDYQPDAHQGPAIWIKCAVAGLVPEVPLGSDPCVVYLPGVSRNDLRAIENCPRHLQPLAELQYRGVFWSQANGKDWTLNAFLASKNGGLGLAVTQDKATQEALAQALGSGVLLDRSVEGFSGRQIHADWLHSLLAPNPTRDLLFWMNDPETAKTQWAGARWSVFMKRCKSDFGFDPLADGVLVAAERLAKREGKWAAVAESYRDAFTSFPNVFELLTKVQPPSLGLFDDLGALDGYPQVNDQREGALRYALAAFGAMTAEEARGAIQVAEKEHGVRRGWLWARMGHSPLAIALGHLAEVGARSAQLPSGDTPDALAQGYRDEAWKVDAEALRALGAVHAKADIEAVSTALRAIYLPWCEELARRLQTAMKKDGGFGNGHAPIGAVGEAKLDGLCTVFVDGLRYDTARMLQGRLTDSGHVAIASGWTSLPSVTASGKAWASPVATLVSGDSSDADFEPRVAADGKPLSGHNFRKLLTEQGIQVLQPNETGDPSGRAWTEVGDLDHFGHAHGIRLARDLDVQLGQVTERVQELQEAGWARIRIVTDHGWLLIPGGLPKAELSKHEAETRWGRCAVLKDSAHGTPLTFGWSWCDEVQVAYAPGVSCFIAGNEYAHGGLSLQECLVPTLTVTRDDAQAGAASATIKSVAWKRLRCTVEVDSVAAGLTVDLRTKAALASSSLAESVKPLHDGRASLAVADDDKEGTAVIVVVLDAAGNVIQKATTTVGG